MLLTCRTQAASHPWAPPARSARPAGRNWSADDILSALGTCQTGLPGHVAAARRKQYGLNTLPRVPTRPWYLDLGANFVHLFALLLWCGAGLAWVAGMPALSWAIVVVIVVNGLFSYWQEYQAERAAEALLALLPHQVTVRRDGTEHTVPASDVVPGDILILTEGQAIPADARVIVSERLRIDTSALTGESRPVPRTDHAVDAAGRAAVVLPNLVFAGTSVASGRGTAVVFATGSTTEFARIAQLTQGQAERPSPLERELRSITRLVTILAVSLGVGFFVIGTLIAHLTPVAGFLFAVGIIVANVPEGLLPTLTLSLAMGVRRMAARQALVKRLSAVETLGATTVILTDKTGTLTENEMTVREAWLGGRCYEFSGVGYDPAGSVTPTDDGLGDPNGLSEFLRAAALCCDAQLVAPNAAQQRWEAIGDPTEAALLVAATKAGVSHEVLSAWPRLAELPFDSARRRMTTIQSIDGAVVACVKGAPSEVFPRCTLVRWTPASAPFDPAQRQLAQVAHDALAGRGLRVLAVATRALDGAAPPAGGWRDHEVERDLDAAGAPGDGRSAAAGSSARAGRVPPGRRARDHGDRRQRSDRRRHCPRNRPRHDRCARGHRPGTRPPRRA